MDNTETAYRAVADMVVAFLNHNSIDPAQLPKLVAQLRAALVGDGAPEANLASAKPPETPIGVDDGQRPEPAVPVAESIHREFLVSLEDGRHYRSLKRHLMAKYGMTPEAYRQKWGLPDDYPMVAPSYAEERSLVAKRTGLGKSTPSKTTRTRQRAR